MIDFFHKLSFIQLEHIKDTLISPEVKRQVDLIQSAMISKLEMEVRHSCTNFFFALFPLIDCLTPFIFQLQHVKDHTIGGPEIKDLIRTDIDSILNVAIQSEIQNQVRTISLTVLTNNITLLE